MSHVPGWSPIDTERRPDYEGRVIKHLWMATRRELDVHVEFTDGSRLRVQQDEGWHVTEWDAGGRMVRE